MDTFVAKAVHSRGPEYFEAERMYRLAGTIPPVPSPSTITDPLSTLILHVLRQWKQPQAADFDAALVYLDGLPARLARTPITSPSPSGIAAYLSQHFGARVADLLAVHLIKQTDWPHWRVSGVLLYLREQARPSTTAALIRFVSETSNADWIAVALEAIQAARDPDLAAKIAAEQRSLESEKRPLPNALKELTKKR
jgi:hypothetical protein